MVDSPPAPSLLRKEGGNSDRFALLLPSLPQVERVGQRSVAGVSKLAGQL